MDWTQIVIAGLMGVGGVGLWQAFIVKQRLDAKERVDIHDAQVELRKELRELVEKAQAEKAAIITERISDRHLWQERIATIEQQQQKTRAELSLTTSAYKEIRSELHKTQNELKTALEKLEAMRLENKRLMTERDELHVRVRHLERIIDKEGLDTGPLDQGKK